MQITVLFFAMHRRTAGTDQTALELPQGATARDAATRCETLFGLTLGGSMIAINDQYATPDDALHNGDTVAFVPPVAGGAPDFLPNFFLVTPNPLDIAALHAKLHHANWGGQAMFMGSTRSPNNGLEIERLEYEAYPALCYNVMAQLATQAHATWDLGAVVLAHRTGLVLPGQTSIVVAAASAHRVACQEAVPWLVNQAKARLPVWKLEVATTGERWVEGSSSAPTL